MGGNGECDGNSGTFGKRGVSTYGDGKSAFSGISSGDEMVVVAVAK